MQIGGGELNFKMNFVAKNETYFFHKFRKEFCLFFFRKLYLMTSFTLLNP